MALEEGWNNDPLKELYPTQDHTSNPTKWLEILLNVLRMPDKETNLSVYQTQTL